MSKYVLKDETDPFGNPRLVLRQQTSNGEFAPIAARNATQSLLALPKSLQTEGFPRLYEMGFQHVKAGEYEQAFAIGSLLVTKCDNQTRVEAYQVRGTALFGLELYPDAINDLTIAIGGIQNDARYRELIDGGILTELFITRAECYRETNDLKKALDDYSAAIRVTPDKYDAYIGRAQTLSAMKAHELAIADFNIAWKGGNCYVHLGRAQAYAALGDTPRALADFESYSKLVADAYGFREFGKYLLSLGRSQDALQQFQKAVDMAPTHRENYQLRAGAFRSIGNDSAAEQDEATALKLKALDDKYTTYLRAAKEMHGLGFTKVPADADTRTRPNYLTSIVLGVLTLVGSYGVLAVVYSVVLSKSDSGCGAIGIIILPFVLAGWVIRERIQKPRQQARNAEIYFREIAAREAQMPAFSEFFKEYIKARNGSDLSQLEQRTRPLFEDGGAAQGFTKSSI